MTYLKAIAAAPADADFVSFMLDDKWCILGREPDGTFAFAAKVSSTGYSVFTSGVSAQSKSLWSYNRRQFICGTLDQLD